MKSPYEILEELNVTNSRLDKLATLEKYKDHELFKKVCFATYDGFTSYYIKQIPERVGGTAAFAKDVWDFAFGTLEMLSSREVTGHEAKFLVQHTLNAMTEEDAAVFAKILERDLGANVTGSSMNKVWGKDFIKKYPCMLCQPHSEKNLEKIKFPAVLQLKEDGMRCNLHVAEGAVDARTRSGHLLNLNNAFDALLERMSNEVLDGELRILTEDRKGYLPRKESNGILRRANIETGGKGLPVEYTDRIVLIAWDIIPKDIFDNGETFNTPYVQRFHKVQDVVAELDQVVPSQTHNIDSMKDANRLFAKFLQAGEEGAIIKNVDSPWIDGRSKEQVKMKLAVEFEMMVTGINEGTGRAAGTLGAFTLSSSCGAIVCNSGSGLNDETRVEYFTEDMIGNIVTISGNEIMTKKGEDLKSIFIPVFIEVRDDKSTANSLAEIEELFEEAKKVK